MQQLRSQHPSIQNRIVNPDRHFWWQLLDIQDSRTGWRVHLPGKSKRQLLLTSQVSSYCLLALQGGARWIDPFVWEPLSAKQCKLKGSICPPYKWADTAFLTLHGITVSKYTYFGKTIKPRKTAPLRYCICLVTIHDTYLLSHPCGA